MNLFIFIKVKLYINHEEMYNGKVIGKNNSNKITGKKYNSKQMTF